MEQLPYGKMSELDRNLVGLWVLSGSWLFLSYHMVKCLKLVGTWSGGERVVGYSLNLARTWSEVELVVGFSLVLKGI